MYQFVIENRVFLSVILKKQVILRVSEQPFFCSNKFVITMAELTIHWLKKGIGKRFYYDICRKFGIPDYVSINGETPCDIRDEDMKLLLECEKRGFIEIRNKKS